MPRRNLSGAVEDMCRVCTHDSLDHGTWKQQMTACEVTTCPLYPVRPITHGGMPDVIVERLEAQFGLTRPQVMVWLDAPQLPPDGGDYRAAPRAQGPLRFGRLIEGLPETDS